LAISVSTELSGSCLWASITQYIAFASRTTNAAITKVHRELEKTGEVSGAGPPEDHLANHLSADLAGLCRCVDLGGGPRGEGVFNSVILGKPGKSHCGGAAVAFLG
jgi:hypothetical protein